MNWPSTLVSYKKTDIFTEDTLPAGLQQSHRTKGGVWALIRILEGELQFQLEGGMPEILSRSNPGLVEPDLPHHIEAVGPVRFYIEFFRDASSTEYEE